MDHEGVKPDVLILGKALSGGVLPVSAVFANNSVMDVGIYLSCRLNKPVDTILNGTKHPSLSLDSTLHTTLGVPLLFLE